MTSLWVKLRNAIEGECETLKNLVNPLTHELEPLAEQDLKEVTAAAVTAGTASVVESGSLSLTNIEKAFVVGGRAAVSTAAAKGIQLTEKAGLGVATLAGIAPPAAGAQ